MSNKFIAGNWKMNGGGADALALANALRQKITNPLCTVCVCVPFTAIAAVGEALRGTSIHVGAQNVAWADSGAFTGEISADMLAYAGAKYVITGHSERRGMFGETDESVNKRTQKALEKGLTPILCVGETLDERQSGITEKVLAAQLKGGLNGFTAQQAASLIVAYEPVWAIGTGVTATADEAENTINFIRSWLVSKFEKSPKILYGGSMNALNAGELLQRKIDGGLIGGASLKPDDFAEIVRVAGEL